MIFWLLGLLMFVCDRGWQCEGGESGNPYQLVVVLVPSKD